MKDPTAANEVVTVRVSPFEKKLVEAAAEMENQSKSAFARDQIVERAIDLCDDYRSRLRGGGR